MIGSMKLLTIDTLNYETSVKLFCKCLLLELKSVGGYTSSTRMLNEHI
jgi:hypothetical protein